MDRMILIVAALLLAVCLNALGNTMLKIGMSQVSQLQISTPLQLALTALTSPWVLLGIALYLLALLGYTYAYAHFNLSFVYPITVGLGFIAVLSLSSIFLREKIGVSQILGCIVILIGVWIASSSWLIEEIGSKS
jgi:multidrug transporter EmrE-like cation transporter